MNSLWKTIINYCQDHYQQQITRKNLLTHLSNKGYSYSASLDTYRRYLTCIGYLKHIGRGTYFVNSKISKNLTINTVKNLAYNYKLDLQKVTNILNLGGIVYYE